MDLREFGRILRAHWVAIVAATLIGVLAGFGWSLLQPKIYSADASGYVRSINADGSVGAALTADQLAQTRVTSYLDIGTWRSVAQYAIDELGLTDTPERLVSQVSVTNPVDSVIIKVSVSAASPEQARDIAEAWIKGMANEISKIEATSDGSSPPVMLVPGDSARLPTAPSSPNVKLNLAIGGLGGIALGLGYALLRHKLDRRARHPKDVERESGAAVIATLPLEKNFSDQRTLLSFRENRRGGNSLFAVTESLRELRTNLQYVNVDSPPRSIVVTSPLPGDGKSTIAANLALSLAAAGEKVTLIDADLRRPVVASIFDLPNDAGLSDVLAGRAAIDDVSHRLAAGGNLRVLTSGRVPPNPSELLASKRMRDLVTSLRAEGMVIIDTPPTIPVTDAAVLTSATDGAILVISAGRTTFDMLTKGVGNLRKAGGTVLGIVLNKVPRTGATAAYYGYQYQGVYYGQGGDAQKSPGKRRGKGSGAKTRDGATAAELGTSRTAAATPAVVPAAAPVAAPAAAQAAPAVVPLRQAADPAPKATRSRAHREQLREAQQSRPGPVRTGNPYDGVTLSFEELLEDARARKDDQRTLG